MSNEDKYPDGFTPEMLEMLENDLTTGKGHVVLLLFVPPFA